MKEQIVASVIEEWAKVTQMQSELNELTAHYERYRFLTQDLRERLPRLKKLELLLSPKPKVANLPLWELIELFLHVKSEANIRDIQEFLKPVGRRGVSRQAIFSALKIHGDIFHSRKKGKEGGKRARKKRKEKKNTFESIVSVLLLRKIKLYIYKPAGKNW